jgi:non-lysosomal glucosylceramidase
MEKGSDVGLGGLSFRARALLTSTLALILHAASAQTTENPLSHLQFENIGTVTKDMEFRYFHQPDDYLENPDLWSIRSDAMYLYRVDGAKKVAPPEGMRSAVPLGGLGSGTLELRADGSLGDWNIFNNSPAYGEKVQIEDALFGIRTVEANGKVFVSALRIHPPAGIPAIQQIQYSGEFPVSRLKFNDPKLSVAVDLYAYSEFKLRDPDASATPAAIFTFVLRNPTTHTIPTSLVFMLPNRIDGHVQLSHGLTFLRDGKLPLSGSIAVCTVGSVEKSEAAAGSESKTLWNAFSSGESIGTAIMPEEAPRYGASVATVRLRPHAEAVVTFILAWYLPNRPFLTENAGNFYATLYSNAENVTDKVAARLNDDWRSLLEWQEVMQANSLPDWLQDSLINGVATMYKTGMRFRDGRWRQWESFACADVDPGHIDFYQSLPYMFFYPELRKQLLTRYAAVQESNGFIPEELITGGVPKNLLSAAGPLDIPGGRHMGDSDTVFILGVLQYYEWTGDQEFLDAMWPNVRKAAFWQIARAQNFGLPEYLQTTYDLFEYEKKTLVSYNAFLHLTAMLAAEKLAQIHKEPEDAEKFQAAFQAGQHSLEQHLWTGKYFRAWWSDGKPYPNALMADTLYGQLWAAALNLAPVISKEKLLSHLRSEAELNGNPFGLRIMSGTDSKDTIDAYTAWKPGQPFPNDNLIWPAGSLDWGSLEIFLGGNVEEALSEAKKVISNQRLNLGDQWNYTDLNNNWDGSPWGNSHYTRQLIQWMLPLAISGQRWDAGSRSLSFSPANSAFQTCPFFTPQATGLLQSSGASRWRITITSGELAIHSIKIDSQTWSGDTVLHAGDSLDVPSSPHGPEIRSKSE